MFQATMQLLEDKNKLKVMTTREQLLKDLGFSDELIEKLQSTEENIYSKKKIMTLFLLKISTNL